MMNSINPHLTILPTQHKFLIFSCFHQTKSENKIYITYRFLMNQITSINRNTLQLVGVTAMLIASKYEEIYAPEVR